MSVFLSFVNINNTDYSLSHVVCATLQASDETSPSALGHKRACLMDLCNTDLISIENEVSWFQCEFDAATGEYVFDCELNSGKRYQHTFNKTLLDALLAEFPEGKEISLTIR